MKKIFGCGESFTEFNKRGQKVVLWADDANGAENEAMYKPIPFFLSSRGYGVFMHTSSPITCDFGKYYTGDYSLMIGDDEADIFIFLGEPKDILNEYTNLTGKATMPPLWSFGFWMSRITYFSETEGREVTKKLRDNRIPSDVIHFDTGWFGTDWRCDYQFSKTRFENAAKMMTDFKKMGFQTCLWQLPYFVPKNTLFPEIIEKGLFVKDCKGNLPYEDAVLDFSNPSTVKWYQDKIAGLLHQGVGVIKADFGEAAPQNLVSTDSSGQTITIKWRKNIEADFMRYRVFRGTSPNPTIKVDSMVSGITDTTKIFTGLTVGTRYYFRITAVDSAYNESGYSNEINTIPQTNIAFKDGLWYKAQNAASNKNNNPIGRFKLTADANGATLASVNVTFSGSFFGVTGVKLWSSADSIFGGDSRLDSVTFKISPVALSGNASAIDAGGTYYFVTVDLGASSGNITAKFASNADITLTAGTLTGTITDAPLAGNLAIITHVDNEEEQLALRVFALSQNYPNPFNPTTTISFTLAENGYVSLKVFDVLGREAVTLVNAHLNAGVVHHAVLDASHLSSGMYFYRLEAGKNVMVKKFVLLK